MLQRRRFVLLLHDRIVELENARVTLAQKKKSHTQRKAAEAEAEKRAFEADCDVHIELIRNGGVGIRKKRALDSQRGLFNRNVENA